MGRSADRTVNRVLVAAAVAVAITIAAVIPAAAQVVDLSSRGGDLSSRIDAALRQAAASAEEGSRFYLVFRFSGLLPSDAEAGGGGAFMVMRYDGWSTIGSGGLLQSRDPWNRMGEGERLLDLATLQMVRPPAAPVLVERPMLAFVRGIVARGGAAVLDDIDLKLPEGRLRLRGRTAYWLGETDSGQIAAWIASADELPAERVTKAFKRDLVGLLSVQPPEGRVLGLLERMATGHEDETVRHRAITYLGRRPEDVSRMLNRIVDTASEPKDRAEALQALADRLGPQSRDRLIRSAENRGEDEAVRRMAISYLSRIEGNDVDAVLERLLADPDARTRARVVNAWERRAPARAVPLLERTARGDEAERVRRQAVESLGDIDGPLAKAALERLFDESDDQQLRRKVLGALVKMKGDDKVSWLAGLAAGDPSMEIRKEAIRQLGRLKDDPRARRALERILDVGPGRP